MAISLHTPWILLGALALEGLVGYPATLWHSIGHPVSWMGRFLNFGEARFNSQGRHIGRDFVGGLVWLAIGVVLTGGTMWILSDALLLMTFGWVLELLIIATLVASRSLYTHVRDVQSALQKNQIEDARQKVSLIVGRNTDTLEEPAIARAAVESLAENASDGVIAPLFWGVVAGLPGIAVYKLVNTADSMWGHRNARYEWFGKSAARLDDFLNLIPARITGLFLCVVAIGVGRGRATFSVMRRDAPKHLSPNAGWPEAAMAGALDCRLGGPREYQGQLTDGVWLGDGSPELGASDLRRALILYLQMLTVAAAMIFITGLFGGWTI